MTAVCPACGLLHETTTEQAMSPIAAERMCRTCWCSASLEALAEIGRDSRAEGQTELGGAR